MVVVGPLRVGDQRPWVGGMRNGGQPRLGPRLEQRAGGGMAGPPLPHTGDTTVLRAPQFQHARLPVRSVISGLSGGDRPGLLIAFREVCSTE